MFAAGCAGEKTLKIGQHLAKLRTRVGCLAFVDSRGCVQSFCPQWIFVSSSICLL